ncbi:MAG: hypothetical protein Q8736_02795, partial [Sweet potato little leaf phytoplasma]|nr:hypothetical protein [Sweet potato little leaf phytoplasma]
KDQGSSADIMFLPLFKALKLCKENMTPFEGEIIGFTGDTVVPLGYIQLPVTLGKPPSARTNAILGRACLQAFGAVVSTIHLAMKFIGMDNKVVTIKADQELARLCYNTNLRATKTADQRRLEKMNLSKGTILLTDVNFCIY